MRQESVISLVVDSVDQIHTRPKSRPVASGLKFQCLTRKTF